MHRFITAALIALSSAAGCAPELSSDWLLEVTFDDGFSVEGEMDLDVEDDDVEGSFWIQLEEDCEDLEGEVTGDLDDDLTEMTLEFEFDDWYCGGDTYGFYDLEAVLEIEEVDLFEQPEAMIGDGEWGGEDMEVEAKKKQPC